MSDLHLSDKPPIFRSEEKDWYAVMARQLGELDRLAKSFGGVPIVCAGDVFHKWNPPPKLINFCMDELPHLYAVPGQHDLKHHSLEDVRDTAYWTLVKAGKITNLKCGNPFSVGKLTLWGFPWGIDLRPKPPHAILEGLHVAVVHKYVWTKKCSYVGAPEDNRLKRVREKLTGYDVAVFGDNHLGFTSHEEGGCNLINCGAFLRRNSDQRNYKPMTGLILESGKIEVHYLDVSEDVMMNEQKAQNFAEKMEFEDFLEGLSGLETKSIDFKEAVYRTCESKGVPEGAMKYVREALGDS